MLRIDNMEKLTLKNMLENSMEKRLAEQDPQPGGHCFGYHRDLRGYIYSGHNERSYGTARGCRPERRNITYSYQ